VQGCKPVEVPIVEDNFERGGEWYDGE